nr:receptor-like serine/threonine-protein kinase SD1-8 [Ipomoea batatas]
MEQFHEIVRILGQIRQHGMNMDDSIAIASIIDKLPPSWKKVHRSLMQRKEEITMEQLGSHLYVEEGIRQKEIWKKRKAQMEGKSSGDHGQTDDSWWVDTGATRHVCKDINLYKVYKSLENGSSLYMGNDSMILIPRFTIAVNTITPTQPLAQNQTLVSAGGVFQLGFFSPGGNSGGLYVGIWYKEIQDKTIVWVANRDKPITNSIGFLKIGEDGNINLVDGTGNSIWSTLRMHTH